MTKEEEAEEKAMAKAMVVKEWRFSIVSSSRVLHLKVYSKEEFEAWTSALAAALEEVLLAEDRLAAAPARPGEWKVASPNPSQKRIVPGEAPIEEVDDVFCGVLRKRGGLGRLQKRWCILRLHNMTLSYYKQSRSWVPQGIIYLHDAEIKRGWVVDTHPPTVESDMPFSAPFDVESSGEAVAEVAEDLEQESSTPLKDASPDSIEDEHAEMSPSSAKEADEHCFSLITPSRTYYLRADIPGEPGAEDWINILQSLDEAKEARKLSSRRSLSAAPDRCAVIPKNERMLFFQSPKAKHLHAMGLTLGKRLKATLCNNRFFVVDDYVAEDEEHSSTGIIISKHFMGSLRVYQSMPRSNAGLVLHHESDANIHNPTFVKSVANQFYLLKSLPFLFRLPTLREIDDHGG